MPGRARSPCSTCRWPNPYVLAGALPAAVEQLNLARKAKDVSFYDQAVIDARERELQARQKAEKEEEKER